MKRIGIIIQRYGEGILGGSEAYCRRVAGLLTQWYEVEVLTSCCSNYLTWENDLPDGESMDGQIHVRRFPTARAKWLDEEINAHAFMDGASVEDGREWNKAQGPYCPDLVAYVEEHVDDYDAFILMTYLYYPTVFSSYAVGHKAVFIPTAHDEGPIYQPLIREVFGNARAWFFLTPVERDFVTGMFPSDGKIINRVGHGAAGVDVPTDLIADRPLREQYELGDSPYLLYAGRIDVNKGFPRTFHQFNRYIKEHPEHSDLQLVLIGSRDMAPADCANARCLGFVPEKDKYSLMRSAFALLQPSDNESLSLVALEAMGVGTPMLASSECPVLVRHCLASNAGLYYRNYDQFSGVLDYLFDHPAEHDQMSRNAARYVAENFEWSMVASELHDMVERVAE